MVCPRGRSEPFHTAARTFPFAWRRARLTAHKTHGTTSARKNENRTSKLTICQKLASCRIDSVRLAGFSPLDKHDIVQRCIGGDAVTELPGDFAVAASGTTPESKPFVFLITSAISAIPYFYYADDQGFFHGASVFEVVEEGRLPWEWNMRAVNCVAILDHCVGDDSLHARVKRAKPASLYYWCEGRLEVKHFSFPSDIFSAGKMNLDDAVEAYEQVFSEYCSCRNEVALSMSAGLDSRALLAGLMARDRRPLLGTMGHADSTDLKIARTIADDLNLEHRVVELKVDDYLRYGSEIARLTGGTKTLANWHTYIYIRKVDFPAGCLHFAGANGELFRSYYFDKGMLAVLADLLPADSAMKLLFSYKYSPGRRLEGVWGKAFGNSTFAWNQIPALCAASVPSSCSVLSDKLDYFYTFERVRHFIGNGLCLYNAAVLTGSPFLDQRVTSAGARLPTAAKRNNAFHLHLIRNSFPQLMDYPVDDTTRSLRNQAGGLYWLRRRPSTGYGIQQQLFQDKRLVEVYLDSPYLDQFLARPERQKALEQKAWQVFNFLTTMHFACSEIEKIETSRRS